MLQVHQAIPFDDLSEALACPEVDIVFEWISYTLDLANTSSIAEVASDTVTLTEFFGHYSIHSQRIPHTRGPQRVVL